MNQFFRVRTVEKADFHSKVNLVFRKQLILNILKFAILLNAARL